MPKKFYRKNKTQIGGVELPYNVYSIHTKESPRIKEDSSILFASIDPGFKNCGFYVAALDKNKTLKSICLENLCFSNEKSVSDCESYINCMKKFEEPELFNYMKNCHFIIIESQMSFAPRNARMGQNLITYFTTRFKDIGNRPIVIEINSRAKTVLLGCPKGLPKKGKGSYKDWCKEKALFILKERNNEEDKFIKLIQSSKKSDDISDVICQLEAFLKVYDLERIKISC